MKKELFSKIRCALFFIVLYASWIIPCFMKYQEDYGTPKTEEMIESTEDVLRFDMEAVEVEPTVELTDIAKVEQPSMESMGEYRLTAYCSCEKCCKQWAQNRPRDEFGNEIVIGASGAVLEAGKSVAVDPDVIPYGTAVIINGHEYIAHDCGGPIKGNCIDIYFDSHEDALQFGIQYAEVFVVVMEDD